MNIITGIDVTLKADGTIIFNGSIVPSGTEEYDKFRSLYQACKGRPAGTKKAVFDEAVVNGVLPKCVISVYGNDVDTINQTIAQNEEDILKEGLSGLLNFFSEFDFVPNFRFINTLSKVTSNKVETKSYISNYFSLIDSPYKFDVVEKMKSTEFNDIYTKLKGHSTKNTINERFKIYFGAPGTGKTTVALQETDNRCIVCNNAMSPSDLMEDFDFTDDGKPTFKKSKLWECMENGLPITLDEMNLLPFDSLRFLQGILDGKEQFQYKGKDVVIKKGFEVICTMNLSVNGMTFGLPEPLVDRAKEIKEFKLNVESFLKMFD